MMSPHEQFLVENIEELIVEVDSVARCLRLCAERLLSRARHLKNGKRLKSSVEERRAEAERLLDRFRRLPERDRQRFLGEAKRTGRKNHDAV